MSKESIGQNVIADVDGNFLHLIIDLEQTHGLSKSGKTISVASTRGNTKIRDNDDREVVVGLNVYRYPDEKEGA